MFKIHFAYEPTKDYLRGLDKATRNRVLRVIGLLELNGHELGPPYCEPLGGGLHELKTRGRNAQRVYFAFIEGVGQILNASDKDDQETAIRLARELLKELKGRK